MPAPGETRVLSDVDAVRALPQPGEAFGHYRIVRLLGHGGMGAVFEAEDTDSGRRVALKVLGHRLDSPEARSRFFREGRLAASVNHPNSVYVFGTEDIAGIPVIAMELVAGGTLQDRVTRDGPMPAPQVVDSVLQIIAGLEAAQRVGVLHRDIKPSNCFVEADGTVKIGDFGLSISTVVRTEPAITATGAFLGTPAFSSPEQLRGDELTVRSDIYSVGVTLYYLLTGHHPFEAPDLVRMLATVLERRAESPDLRRPGLPPGLCRIVLRCLEKDPEKRFRSYDDLRTALLPYAPAAPTPATLGLRLVAHVLDALLLLIPYALLDWWISLAGPGGTRSHAIDLAGLEVPKILLQNFCHAVVLLTYFGLLEGYGGASVGKLICRLRVARPDRSPPGVLRAVLRALVLTAPPTAVWLLGWAVIHTWPPGPEVTVWTQRIGFLVLGISALMFATARRRNGFAGLHDLATGTRVTLKSAVEPRPTPEPASESSPPLDRLPMVGPYHVLGQLALENGAELLLGFDARLLRRVWIRRQPPGAAPVAPALRQLGRPGRLRWLTAQRTNTEAWDAYEAPPGQPLAALMAKAQDWGRVRFWLLDLAEELHAAAPDGSLPAVLDLDRVWITADGRAKLLDFPAPGTAPLPIGRFPLTSSSAPAPQIFLRQVALSALAGRPVDLNSTGTVALKAPPALHASRFLETLKPGPGLKDRIDDLRSSLGLPARVSRWLRAAWLIGAMSFPLACALVGGFLQVHNFPETVEQAALGWYGALALAAAKIGYHAAVTFVIVPCWIASVLFRGGALAKVLGVVFVIRTGARASRWRVTARSVAAWLPFVVQPSGIALLSPALGPVGALFSVAGLCAALALVSVLLPSRGLADRVVGTWPVPR